MNICLYFNRLFYFCNVFSVIRRECFDLYVDILQYILLHNPRPASVQIRDTPDYEYNGVGHGLLGLKIHTRGFGFGKPLKLFVILALNRLNSYTIRLITYIL